MTRLLGAVVLAGFLLAACSSDPYDYRTWTKQLDDQHTSERAVQELEHLGNPNAIPDLGKAWVSQAKPVRLLQVMIQLARPMTPAQAEKENFTDYAAKGREASWDKVVPFLKQALDEIDESNPRSIDSAQKAATALGEAGLADGLESLVKLAEKPSTKKIIPAQTEAVRAMGKFDAEKGKASAALQKILDHEPPPSPRTVAGDAKAAATEKYTLFMLMANAAITGLGDLNDPGATKVLMLSLYRFPDLYPAIRKALVAIGPTAKKALQDTLAGTYQPVNDLHMDEFCGDNGELKATGKCLPYGVRDYQAAVVISDFYDPETVPTLLAALDKEAKPIEYQNKQPGSVTQHNAIFEALRKIGSPTAADKVRSIWMSKGAPAPKKPGEPKAGEVSDMTKALAMGAYAYLSRDLQGVKELGMVAADNGAIDELRQEAATAFARLAVEKSDVDQLATLSKKYLDAAQKDRDKESVKAPGAKTSPKEDAEASDKEFAKAKDARDAARKAAAEASRSSTLTVDQIKAATAAVKEAEYNYDVAKDDNTAKTSAFKELEDQAKYHKSIARAFQMHAARIEVAVRCKKDLKCYADTLKQTPDDSVKYLAGWIKDEKNNVEDLTKWTKEEKQGLLQGEVERAMIELGKAGLAASAYSEVLLDAAKSDDRVVRQGILLALPKIAKVPCNTCEAKLDAAVKAGEGKTTLGTLNNETTMLRNYFAWAGGKTPSKADPNAPSEEPAKTEEPKKEEPAKTEEPKKEEPAKTEPAKEDPKKPAGKAAVPPVKKKGK